MLRLTRAGGNVSGNLPGTDWTVFVSDDPNYMPLEWAYSSVPHYAQEKLVSAVLVSDITKPVKFRNPLNSYLAIIDCSGALTLSSNTFTLYFTVIIFRTSTYPYVLSLGKKIQLCFINKPRLYIFFNLCDVRILIKI